ncbi:hypothetical protein B0T10DRAFT_597189, partial [Thelonectria olida]
PKPSGGSLRAVRVTKKPDPNLLISSSWGKRLKPPDRGRATRRYRLRGQKCCSMRLNMRIACAWVYVGGACDTEEWGPACQRCLRQATSREPRLEDNRAGKLWHSELLELGVARVSVVKAQHETPLEFSWNPARMLMKRRESAHGTPRSVEASRYQEGWKDRVQSWPTPSPHPQQHKFGPASLITCRNTSSRSGASSRFVTTNPTLCIVNGPHWLWRSLACIPSALFRT